MGSDSYPFAKGPTIDEEKKASASRVRRQTCFVFYRSSHVLLAYVDKKYEEEKKKKN